MTHALPPPHRLRVCGTTQREVTIIEGGICRVLSWRLLSVTSYDFASILGRMPSEIPVKWIDATSLLDTMANNASESKRAAIDEMAIMQKALDNALYPNGGPIAAATRTRSNSRGGIPDKVKK